MATDSAKKKALAALISCDTFTEAAKEAGVSRRSLYNWISTDREFARAYREGSEVAMLERLDGLEAQRQAALDAIAEVMNDGEQPGAVRVKAAQAILEATGEAINAAHALTAKNMDRTSPLFSEF